MEPMNRGKYLLTIDVAVANSLSLHLTAQVLVAGCVLLKCLPAEMCLAWPVVGELELTMKLRNWDYRFGDQISAPQVLLQ